MSWQELISANSATWNGLEEYFQERIKDLTTICTSPGSTVDEIRAAQAGISECERIRSLPQMIQAEIQIRANTVRSEY